MLLEGQPEEDTDEFPLSEESELSGLLSPRRVSAWSDVEDDSPPPPPLQEITRRLKLKTIRKNRSFFIYFP